MAQVSRYPIHRDVEKRIAEIFRSTIASLHTSEEIEDFLHEFLSPIENIMLGKRLAIAVLLAKGYRYETIAAILRVTPTTISGVSLRLKYAGKGYKKVVEKILRDEKIDDFWEKVDEILSSIPHSKGSSLVYQRQEYLKRRKATRKGF